MDGESISLRSILGLLRRKLWLILTVTVLVVAVGGLALLALTPVYSATALVLVDPSKKNLLEPDQSPSFGTSDSARVDSEVELVVSDATLAAAIEKLGLIDDPEFGVRFGLRDKLIAFLRIAEPKLPTGEDALRFVLDGLSSAVSASRRDATFLIDVQARSTRPQMAADLANAVAEAYIAAQLQAKVNSTLAGRDIIEARISDASSTVARSEKSFDDFIDANLAKISAETGRTDLVTLKAEIDQALQQRQQGEATVNTAQASLASRDWASVTAALKTQILTSLESQREQLMASLSGAAEGSQAAVNLRGELEKLESRLEKSASEGIASLKSDLADAQSRAGERRAQLRTAVLGADLPADVLTNIYELQQTAEIARAQYQTLLTRQKDLENQAFLQQADSRVVSPATPPGIASFPNPRLLLTLAAIVGLAAGIGLAFLIETFVGGFTSAEQVQDVLRLTVAGAVPKQKPPKRGEAGEPRSVANSLIVAPLSAFSESIRRVRIGLDQALAARQRNDTVDAPSGAVIMVTSSVPNEGKTTLSLALARTYALSGQATLLIDCDLRRPSIHRQLGIEPETGLLEFLSDRNQVADIAASVTKDEASGAHIVLGSRRGDVATDQLLTSRAFSSLIAAARRNFEIVILDVPPVGLVVDGLYVARSADVVAFVIKWSDTPQQEVRAALTALKQAQSGAPPPLVVLNQQDSAGARRGGRYADYYLEA